MGSNVIKLGDKIDIVFLHQNNGKVYKSSVHDILENNILEVAMPTDEGKMVMFQVGFECQYYFYTEKGMYTCETVVVNRYRRENFFLLAVRATSPLKKYQRREFYRIEKSIDMAYYKISDEVAALQTTEELFDEIADPKYIIEKMFARTRDLSGGGLRFTTAEKLESGTKLLVEIRLSNPKMDRTFYLVTNIIDSFEIPDVKDLWIARGRFEFKNKKDRDLIIRYVFEEDRMMRKKENG